MRTESKMAFHTKSRKQSAGWSQRQVFPPNLDLDFIFLTFLKNRVFLYLGSNQVSKLLRPPGEEASFVVAIEAEIVCPRRLVDRQSHRVTIVL